MGQGKSPEHQAMLDRILDAAGREQLEEMKDQIEREREQYLREHPHLALRLAQEEAESRRTPWAALILAGSLIGLVAWDAGRRSGRDEAYRYLCGEGDKQACEAIHQAEVDAANEAAESDRRRPDR